jgi:hypothetical protein
MPTLEELFKSKQLPSQGGKTAEEAYAIRNSKDIRISAADPFVNTVGMSLARLARKNLGARGSETLLEEEVTGARLIRTASMPFIYGTELPRLTLRSTPLLDKMREGTGPEGSVGGGGLLGGFISKARDFVNDKLGIPSGVIPTKVIGFDSISKKGETQNRMIDLAEIKKSGEGSLLGKFLKGTGGGNLKTIGKQALGNAISFGKDKLRGKLFGEGGVTGFNNAGTTGLKNTTINYGSIDNALGVTIGEPNSDGLRDAKGLMYSKTLNLNSDPESKSVGATKPTNNNEPYKLNFIDASEEGGLAAKPSIVIDRTIFSSNPDREGKSFASKIRGPISKDDFIEKKRGMGQIADTINNTNIFEGETLTLGDGTTLDEKDFVPLKFTSIHRNKTVQFRATLSGLSETLSPSWDSHKFIGSPFSNYTYSGIERSVTFNFKVYSLNAEEHKIGWDKINFLNSLVFPQGYYDSSAVVPPFIRLTIGDLYKGKLSFIESLSHTWDDNTPWNVTDKERTVLSNAVGIVTGTSENADIDMKGYRLPMITDVSMTVKFLIGRNNTSGRKFYSFEPQSK